MERRRQGVDSRHDDTIPRTRDHYSSGEVHWKDTGESCENMPKDDGGDNDDKDGGNDHNDEDDDEAECEYVSDSNGDADTSSEDTYSNVLSPLLAVARNLQPLYNFERRVFIIMYQV